MESVRYPQDMETNGCEPAMKQASRLSAAEPVGMGEAATNAVMSEGVTKVIWPPPASKAVAEPATPATRINPETGPVPVLRPVSVVGPVTVIGGVGVAGRHTAIARIEIEPWIAGIRTGIRLCS